jgi:hypothetical protein
MPLTAIITHSQSFSFVLRRLPMPAQPDPETGLIPRPQSGMTWRQAERELPRVRMHFVREFATDSIRLHILKVDDASSKVYALVPTWVEVDTGSTVPSEYFLTLSQSEVLRMGREMEPFTRTAERLADASEEVRETRATRDNYRNQLERVEAHNRDLQAEARTLRRHQAWLERELREAHTERRSGERS